MTGTTPPPAGDEAWKIQAVAELRYQTAYYMEAVQAMMDGVTLGAERVQDKRIELLQAGVETDWGAGVLMFAVTLVLEGTIGPAIAAVAVSTLLRPILRGTSHAIDRMQKVSDFKNMRLFRATAGENRRKAMFEEGLAGTERVDLVLKARELLQHADLLKLNLRRNLGRTGELRKTLTDIGNFVEQNLVATVKAGIASNAVPEEPAPLSSGSPSVDVLSVAMASASRFRLTLAATHEALEATFRQAATPTADITKLLDDYRIDGAVSLPDIRNAFALAAEAMIWAALLVTPAARQELEYRSQGIASSTPLLPGGNERLTAYLAKRFDKELERWALEDDVTTRKDFENQLSAGMRRQPAMRLPRPTGWWSSLDDAERQQLAVLYLAHVAKNPVLPELRLR